jgi:hypothetical protein
MLALARGQATGALTIEGRGRRADLFVDRGVPVALAWHGGHGDRLVEILEACGDFDGHRYARALSFGAPPGSFGTWLVDHGVTSTAAVSLALRTQVRRRIALLMASGSVRGVFDAERVPGCSRLPEPMTMADIVVRGMRARTEGWAYEWMVRQLPEQLTLTGVGEQTATDVALWPAEVATVGLLRRAFPGSVASTEVARTPDALRFVFALWEIGGVVAPGPGSGAYSLLRRKRQHLRTGAPATALLDLPASADAREARSAVRRLVQVLHPDRFEGCAPRLRGVSSEVVAAAVGAAARPDRSRP